VIPPTYNYRYSHLKIVEGCMLRVLIVEEHDGVRRGLETTLRDAFARVLFGAARNVSDALELSAQAAWDLVLLDLELQDCSGLSVLRELHRQRPETPVLALSTYAEPLYLLFALRCGAKGYLSKHRAPEELVHAVRKVLSGGRYPARQVRQGGFHISARGELSRQDS
jgi:DNA-binding NarL/FixJ family response regulator